MKGLSIEERAKAYDEALERAKAIYQGTYKPNVAATIAETLQSVFPELKESEDERIRKELIEFVKSRLAGFPQCDKYLAWLEKQGEQNHADKVEPKFKVGDWVTNGDYTWKIVEVKPLDYILQSQDGNIVDDTISYVDGQFHSFTIEDAKDGDVLVYGDNPADHHVEIIMLFKSMRTSISAFNHFHIWDDKFGINDWCDCGKTAHPAAKEQREQLEKAMADAGYTFDFEKKELKKIEQNPAWSEDDEKMCQETIDWFEKKCFPYALESENPARESINWLKALKQRIKGE